MSRYDELMGKGGMELQALAEDNGVTITASMTRESLVRAIIAKESTNLPAWMLEEVLPEEPVRHGLFATFDRFVENLREFREFFDRHQLEWEAVQSILNRRYKTEDEVRAIAQEEIETFRKDLASKLGPSYKLLLTSQREEDEVEKGESFLNWLSKPGPLTGGDKKKN